MMTISLLGTRNERLPDNIKMKGIMDGGATSHIVNDIGKFKALRTVHRKVPNISKLQKFGSMCFAYKQEKGKLDSRCEQGIFVAFDKNSPAYILYYPGTERVQKHRLVKFTTKTANEKGTQTFESLIGYGDRDVHQKTNNSEENVVDDKMQNVPGQEMQSVVSGTLPEQTECTQPVRITETMNRGNPRRIRKKPAYLQCHDCRSMSFSYVQILVLCLVFAFHDFCLVSHVLFFHVSCVL